MGSQTTLALLLGLLLSAIPRPPAHIRPQGHGTLEVLGYDSADQRVYYVEERGRAREPWEIYACVLGDRYPEKRTRVAAREDDPAQPGYLEWRIRDLCGRLKPLEPAILYDLSVHVWRRGVDTVATSRGPLVRTHVGVELREGDLQARAGITTSCEARTGVSALYRVPGDPRAIAIISYTGQPESTCVEVEEPIVLMPPDTSERHRSYSPTTSLIEGTATLTGRVSSERGNALAMVYVVIPGTKLGVYSDSEGWFTIHGIAPGPQAIMFNALGYGRLTLRDTLVSGSNAPLYAEMSVVRLSRQPDVGGRCEPWFGLSMYQGDRALPLGSVLIDEVGNIPSATITRPEGQLTVSSVSDPCVLSISWAPASRASATVLILDERGNLVREYSVPHGSNPTRLTWDGLDARGTRCPRGSYDVQVRTGGLVLTLEVGRVGT